MKHLKIVFLISILLMLVNSSFSQNRYYGKVTEIIDGRTIIVEPQPQFKIRIQLQYIEVPEAEQKFHKVVVDHLTNLVLNKNVEFRPKNVNDTTQPIGQILLSGIDISQQMLRDGAAWYSVKEKSLQGQAESKIYQSYEAIAKKEKRGIWSIADLKPAWEFRAAKKEEKRKEILRKQKEEKKRIAKLKAEERKKLREKAEAKRIARAKANQLSNKTDSKFGINIAAWQNISTANMSKKSGYRNLYTRFIPQYGIEYIITGKNLNQFNSGEIKLNLESRSLQIKKDKSSLNLKNVFGIGFLSKSKKGKFAASNNLTIYADKKIIELGKAHRLNNNDGKLIHELLLYEISQEHLNTISKAKNVKVKIGEYKGSIDTNYKNMVKELVKSAK